MEAPLFAVVRFLLDCENFGVTVWFFTFMSSSVEVVFVEVNIVKIAYFYFPLFRLYPRYLFSFQISSPLMLGSLEYFLKLAAGFFDFEVAVAV